MGVRRLFFPGEGKMFQGPGAGQKHTTCPKSTKKDSIFLEKNQKTYYFARPRGDKGPLLPSPADTHGEPSLQRSGPAIIWR